MSSHLSPTVFRVADQATIATDILARYAADAAREVEGVRAIAGRRGVRISGKEAIAHRAPRRGGAGRLDPGARARSAGARARIPLEHGGRRAGLGRIVVVDAIE